LFFVHLPLPGNKSDMPLLKSQYHPPAIFRNYHVSTIYAATIRRVQWEQHRERLELPDSDFLDIDWSYSEGNGVKKVLVIMHGLEGSAKRPYVTGMAKYFNARGWDVAAVNLRGCSGELNRKFQSYHAGATDDLDHVIQHILKTEKYDTIALNGFSLGGNLMLKYLGEGREIPEQIKAAVMVSVPCDLYGSLLKLEETRNLLYAKRFIVKLKAHLLARSERFPKKISKKEIAECASLMDIDNLYTSRAHDFENALDYYQKNSSLQFLSKIGIPTLLINAKNDGFLSPGCYPVDIAEQNENFFLEMPRYGGHVGFVQYGPVFYHEERGFEFLDSRIK
jgi:predicted alpha/beta-fold hydrolase